MMFCPEVYSEIVESGLESVDVERYLRSREGKSSPMRGTFFACWALTE